MTTNYHLTVVATGVTIQQVRAVIAFLDTFEIHHKGWTVWGQEFVRLDAIIYQDIPCTEKAHAAMVDRLQEYTPLFTLKTWWGHFKARCPDCLECVEHCVCEFLSDQTLADPVDEE